MYNLHCGAGGEVKAMGELCGCSTLIPAGQGGDVETGQEDVQ